MPPSAPVPDIARAIQLAVAPVFLLSGVGVTLTVLTNRLSRIVDRARSLETVIPTAGHARQDELQRELATLARRAALINRALTLSTTCALLICLVIALLFVAAVFVLNLSAVVALLFAVAVLSFGGALLSFLREIFLATANLRIGLH